MYTFGQETDCVYRLHLGLLTRGKKRLFARFVGIHLDRMDAVQNGQGILSLLANFVPKLVTLIILHSAFTWNFDLVMPQYSAYCSAYCDIYDNLVPGSYCESSQHKVYCCGTTYNKTCCNDSSAEINNADETVCGHSWIYYQWSLIYGLVAVLMVILMIIVCCICCRGYQLVSRRRSENSGSREERGEGNEVDPQTLGFDPTCEYAFEPPRYETLPKDPPKYSEVFSTTDHDNAAFNPDELPPTMEATSSQAETDTVPPYEEATNQRNESGEASGRTAETEVVVTVEENGIRNEIGSDDSLPPTSTSPTSESL